MVEVAADPGGALDRRGDVGLAAEPGEKSLRQWRRRRRRAPAGSHAARPRARAPRGDRAEALLGERVGGREHGLASAGSVPAASTSSWSAKNHESTTARRAPPLGCVGRREPLAQPPVHGLEVMQRRLALADLHLGRGEPGGPSPLGEPAHGERLARSLLAPDRLEPGRPGATRCELVVEAAAKRSVPTAKASRPRWGTVPRRRASMISRRRCGRDHGVVEPELEREQRRG